MAPESLSLQLLWGSLELSALPGQMNPGDQGTDPAAFQHSWPPILENRNFLMTEPYLHPHPHPRPGFLTRNKGGRAQADKWASALGSSSAPCLGAR